MMARVYKRNGITDLFAALNVGTGEGRHRLVDTGVFEVVKQIDKPTHPESSCDPCGVRQPVGR